MARPHQQEIISVDGRRGRVNGYYPVGGLVVLAAVELQTIWQIVGDQFVDDRLIELDGREVRDQIAVRRLPPVNLVEEELWLAAVGTIHICGTIVAVTGREVSSHSYCREVYPVWLKEVGPSFLELLDLDCIDRG